ncbi:molybdopterin-binding protein [Aquimarina hainanensis]
MCKKICKQNIDLIIYTGGTGLSKRDFTHKALLPLLIEEFRD